MPVGICWRNLYRVVAQNYEEAWVEISRDWECECHFQVSSTFQQDISAHVERAQMVPFKFRIKTWDGASVSHLPVPRNHGRLLLPFPPPLSLSNCASVIVTAVLLRAALGTPTTSPAVSLLP